MHIVKPADKEQSKFMVSQPRRQTYIALIWWLVKLVNYGMALALRFASIGSYFAAEIMGYIEFHSSELCNS